MLGGLVFVVKNKHQRTRRSRTPPFARFVLVLADGA
jgi:hypothetical protein